MKKLFTLFATSLLFMTTALAQEKGTHSFELGGGINAYGILGACGGPVRYFGPGAYFEYRYGIADHFDIGGQIHYKYGKGKSEFYGDGSQVYGFVYNQIGAKAVADYNVCPSRLVSPYIGVGGGLGTMMESRSDNAKDKSIYGILAPRIGVQVWHFRLALEIDFAFNGQYGFLSPETANALNLSFMF